jgi:hypothetical protein
MDIPPCLRDAVIKDEQSRSVEGRVGNATIMYGTEAWYISYA